ncbi:MAG: CCA tRNA nucleotidyltransferase [Spirochaetia bacterium]
MEEIEITKVMENDDLRIIAGMAAELGVDAYLVGGSLRDCLLGRETKDLDFALSGAWEELPRIFAARICGTFFWLDEERLQGRVVKKTGGELSFFDFAPLRGETVANDLALRDFTINALALPLGGDRRELIDPLAGRDDLLHGLIRACSAAAFDDDPLRLMRAIRFAAELGFAIEENTWETLCAKGALLKAVAGERVRDELFRTLAAPGCGVSLKQLCDSGLWAEILSAQEWGACAERIPRLEEAEQLCMEVGRLFPESAESLADYLNREVEAGISVLSIIRLAAVLGSGDRGWAAPLARRLRLGKEAGRVLDLFCLDERAVYGMLEQSPAERVIYRFFRDREPAGPGMLIIARAGGAVSTECFLSLMGYWLRYYEAGEADLFLSGGEVMGILGVPPGQVVGEAMESLRVAEGGGIVNSREEARQFIKNLLTSKPPMR